MKKFIIQSVLLLIVITAALFVYKGQTTIPFLPQQSKVAQIIIGEAVIKAEVSDTKEKRGKGLGGRESLATDAGMLFVFEKEDFYPFWMRGLKFPLDFVWIRGDKIVDITENVAPPQPNQSDDTLPIFQSKEMVDKVLEVNGGTVQRLGIKVGNEIELSDK